LTNPILQPWAREELRKLNEACAGRSAALFARVELLAHGVPGFLLYVVNPVFFLQTPREVVMIATDDIMVRHVI